MTILKSVTSKVMFLLKKTKINDFLSKFVNRDFFVLVEYGDLLNIVQIRSGYNLSYFDRSFTAPLIVNTSFSAKKTGAKAYETTGRTQVNVLKLSYQTKSVRVLGRSPHRACLYYS